MKQFNYILISLIAVIAIFTCSCTQALTLSGNLSPTLQTAVLDPCPDHPGYACCATASDIQLLSFGENLDFKAAWDTVIPSEWYPSAWTLQYATAPLDATLNLSTYRAFNVAQYQNGHSLAGAEIQVDWTPATGQQDLKWIQAIHTNASNRGSSQWYLDVLRLKKETPPVYPYSFSDYHFYDMPGRWCDPNQNIYWDAYLYLARVNRTTKVVTVYEGLSWGFTLNCEAVPEPGGLLVMLCPISCLLAMRFKRRV